MIGLKVRWHYADVEHPYKPVNVNPREFLTVIEAVIDDMNRNRFPTPRVELPFFKWMSPEEIGEFYVVASQKRAIKVFHSALPWVGPNGRGVEIGMKIEAKPEIEQELRSFIAHLEQNYRRMGVELS